ncbi:uncharacterized protein [Solanum lycopersicum]|uniref:uncharacterized protein n=1 Tax=Solanum lycopersicum TaxID=4081 RepID=UPI003747B0C0
MQLWNRATIAKLCWDLANKEDKLWIEWIHVYYMRGQNDWQKREQASWMIRKKMQAKQIVDQVHIKEGKGMVKQIYDYLRGEQPKPLWKCLMFKNSSRPKAIFTMWILMYRNLATVDRLAKWGLTHDTATVLCTNMDESLDHMFLQCHYVGEVWERVLAWASFNSNRAETWTQFVQWCIQHGKGKTTRAQLFKMILAKVVYAVWNERNKRIFEDKKSLIDEIVNKIAFVTIARSPISIKRESKRFLVLLSCRDIYLRRRTSGNSHFSRARKKKEEYSVVGFVCRIASAARFRPSFAARRKVMSPYTHVLLQASNAMP